MINKKILIELFESQVENSSYEDKYVDNNYVPCVKFNSDLITSPNLYKTSYDDCEMFIWRKKEDFFLSFNSLPVKISFTEYKRLNKIYTKKKESFYMRLEEDKKLRDKELLNKVFSIKNTNEKRKTMVEKTKKAKTFDENDVAKIVYDYEQ